MRYLSVCSGIEAATVAWHPLGWTPVAFSEIETFPSAVLSHRYPATPNLGDFTAIDADALGSVDLLVGGTPCQAFSFAGKRLSLADARGNLTLSFIGLAHELVALRSLRWAVWENVPGVLSTKDNAFGCFLGGLVGADAPLDCGRGGKWPSAGLVAGPKSRAAWRVLDAQHFGVAQRRRRVFVVVYFGGDRDPSKVLFEPESGRRNPAPSRKSEQVVAALTANGVGTCGADDNQAQAGHLIPSVPVARCQAARHGSRLDFETETFVSVLPIIAQALGVRRLTPRECERLQGFPDDYTLIPMSRATRAKVEEDFVAYLRLSYPDITGDQIRRLAADGPRYKSLGNSMAVPVMQWIGARIQDHEEGKD
jgi:DNA (cytosine-5)-methyltransferase 1